MHAQFINIAKLIPTNIDTFHRIRAIHHVLLAGNCNKYLQRLAMAFAVCQNSDATEGMQIMHKPVFYYT